MMKPFDFFVRCRKAVSKEVPAQRAENNLRDGGAARQAVRRQQGSGPRLVALLSALLLVITLARKDQAMVLTGEFRMHDPSQIVKCEGKYFVFSTGDNLPMRYSTDLINWTAGPPVLSKVPEWARQAVPAATRDLVWAPEVIFLNNRYYLYYSYSTFGSRISAIGLVTSPTLEPTNPNYKWTDEGLVIASNNSNNYNAIDPALTLDTQGELWMSFGSWNSGGIQLVKLDKTIGKPVSKPITLAAGQARGPEAPYIYYRAGYYYLFENEDFCCRGMNSTYRIMMGRSRSITGPYLDKQGKDLARNGGTLFLGTDAEKIGPGHMGILSEGGVDRFSFHYYDGLSNGRPTMGIRPLLWGADGWPKAGFDLPAGRYAIISKATGLALGVQQRRHSRRQQSRRRNYRASCFQRRPDAEVEHQPDR